jgi:hypothetical protein
MDLAARPHKGCMKTREALLSALLKIEEIVAD